MAAIPPERLRTATREKPAARIISASACWSGNMRILSARYSIAVGVAREDAAEAREDLEGPRLIQGYEGRDFQPGEFKAQEAAARPQNTSSLRSRPNPCPCNCAARRPWKRHPHFPTGSGKASASATRNVRSPTIAALDRAVRVPTSSIAWIDVRQDGGAAPLREPAEADVACAAREIEQAAARPRVEQRREDLLPYPMDAERHEVVHEVVAGCHAREDLSHQGSSSRRAARRGSRNRSGRL